MFDLLRLQLGERQVMSRAVADYARDAFRRADAVRRVRRVQLRRRVGADARVVVVEDEGLLVTRVGLAAHAMVAGAEVAGGVVHGRSLLFARDRLAAPRPVLPVRRNNNPLLAQRVPALLPVQRQPLPHASKIKFSPPEKGFSHSGKLLYSCARKSHPETREALRK